MSLLAKIKRWFWCDHQFEFERRIREQNIRLGYRHQSDIYKCKLCKRIRVDEVPGSATRL